MSERLKFKKLKNICTKCDCDVDNMCFMAYTNSTTDIINFLNDSSMLGLSDTDKTEAYEQFLLTIKKYESRINDIIYGELVGLKESKIPFDVDMYFKLDKLFLRWGSWFSRTMLYLRVLYLNDIKCENLSEIIKYTIMEYYNSNKDEYTLSFKDNILAYYFDYFSNCFNPSTAQEFSTIVEYIGIGIVSYFRYIIIQYAQNYMIENKINRFYFSTLFNDLGNLSESTYQIITDKISTYSKNVHIYSLSDIREDDIQFKILKEDVNKHFKSKFETIMVYIPDNSEETGFKHILLS